MPLTRKIVVSLFIVLIFSGSVGINVFAHFCKVDGAEYSYVLPSVEACETEEVAGSCCHGPQLEKKIAIKSNCCEEETAPYGITSDFLQKSASGLSWEFVPLASVSPGYIYNQGVEPKPKAKTKTTRPPPPKKGKQILILHQIFRI